MKNAENKSKRQCILKKLKPAVSVLLVAAAAFCVFERSAQCFKSDEPAALAAAAFTLTNGTLKRAEEEQPNEQAAFIKTQSESKPAEKSDENKKKERDKSGYYDSFAQHEGESKYEIAEKTYGADGTKFANAYIKNKTGLQLDFNSLLKEPLTFNVKENSSSPQVLIYHTHTTEGYIDEDVDFFYDSFYSRTQNSDFNVVAVGKAIADALNKNGINTMHDTTVHDSTYNGSYDRSLQTVESDMNENKDIKVVIDIHRDAIGSETRKVKPVFEYNGKKGAQIMILAGCDEYGERGFDGWKNNLSFALKIQNTAETLYPGMTRPIDFDFFAYNEGVCDGSLLIEIGTEASSIDEAVYSGKLLGEVLSKVLSK